MITSPCRQEVCQLPLPFEQDERILEGRLRGLIGKNLSLVLTDNATVMISVKTVRDKISLRLQRIFLRATDEVVDEIARFVKRGRGRTPLVQRFIRENCVGIKRRPYRVRMRTAGSHHDLRACYERVNREYFGGRVDARITWGARSPRCGARRRTLGSYSGASQIIRVNPLLDRRSVPSFFVRFIVYHEMLHADIGTERKSGKRVIHTAEFRRREKMFREYERAVAWERKWMSR